MDTGWQTLALYIRHCIHHWILNSKVTDIALGCSLVASLSKLIVKYVVVYEISAASHTWSSCSSIAFPFMHKTTIFLDLMNQTQLSFLQSGTESVKTEIKITARYFMDTVNQAGQVTQHSQIVTQEYCSSQGQ